MGNTVGVATGALPVVLAVSLVSPPPVADSVFVAVRAGALVSVALVVSLLLVAAGVASVPAAGVVAALVSTAAVVSAAAAGWTAGADSLIAGWLVATLLVSV